MTRGKLTLPLMILGGLLARPADAGPEFDGRWKAVYATAASERVEAEVSIEGQAGTWITPVRGNQSRGDTCGGRLLPISLRDSGSSTLSLFVDGSTAVPRCKARRARLTVVDSLTLEGEFDDGRVVRLVRP